MKPTVLIMTEDWKQPFKAQDVTNAIQKFSTTTGKIPFLYIHQADDDNYLIMTEQIIGYNELETILDEWWLDDEWDTDRVSYKFILPPES